MTVCSRRAPMFSVRSLTRRREIRNAADRAIGEAQRQALGREQRGVLLDQRALRLGQDPHEILAAERLELDAIITSDGFKIDN